MAQVHWLYLLSTHLSKYINLYLENHMALLQLQHGCPYLDDTPDPAVYIC